VRRELHFLQVLSDDAEDRVRVEADIERGRVRHFVVQYEALIRGKWQAIVRYDTAHGYPHRDLIHPRRPAEKVPLATSDLNSAMTFAIQDVQALWPAYREKYEREFRREKR
jgi:hypothetical protein